MAKEDSVQLRMEVRGKRGAPKENGTPKSRHGYGTPQRIRDRMKYLGECQALSVDDKFALSVERFKEISKKVKKIFIGWSGGKDSTLVIDIAIASGADNFEVVYADSGVEPIETLDYIKLFSKLRGFNFKALIAPTTFWQMTMTHGWPILGGDRFCMGGSWWANAKKARSEGDEVRALAIERAKLSGACSNVLKVVPMDRYARYTGSDCTSMGLMALECVYKPETFGATTKGLKRLDRVLKEDLIVDGQRLSNVEAVIDAGICPTQHLVLSSGLDLKAHDNHRVQTIVGLRRRGQAPELTWTNMEDLEEGQPVLVEGRREFEENVLLVFRERQNKAKAKSVTLPQKMTPELAWLLGFLAGDGHLHMAGKECRGVDFFTSPADIPIVEQFMLDLFDLEPFYKSKEIKHPGTPQAKGWAESEGVDLCFSSMKVGSFFEQLSEKGEGGDWFFENCGAYFLYYLYGRIQADGSADTKGKTWSFSTIDENAAKQIQQLCFLSGVWCHRSYQTYSEDKEVQGVGGIWSLLITPPLGLLEGNKWLSVNKRLVERKCERGYSRCRPFAKDWLKDNNFFVDRVKSVERVPDLRLGDFTTTPSHTYLSNCMVSHNTRQRMLVWLQKGDFYWHKSNKKWIFWAIATWHPKDVMAYFRTKNIPMCALYDPGRLERNGCQACGKSYKWPNNNWQDTYRFHPEIMDEYMTKRGLAQKLLELKRLYHADQLMHFGIDSSWAGEKVWEHYPEMMLQL